MCNELLNNKEYINYQTGEKLDFEIVSQLKDNAMLKVKPELWCEWDFEKNTELGHVIWKVGYGSGKKVWWKCSVCGEDVEQFIKNKVNGHQCKFCKGKAATKTNNLATHFSSIAQQWHPSKNEKLTPHDALPRSEKKVWWLGACGHEWEAMVADRTTGRNCPYCAGKRILIGFNDLWTTHPSVAERLKNPDDGFRVSQGSDCVKDFLCHCGNKITKAIHLVASRGITCPKCSDGISAGEKIVYNILSEFNVNFKYDSSTPWSETKRFDFIIEELNCIIEIHGEHHYKNRKSNYSLSNAKTLNDEIQNDYFKKELAIKNGMYNYYELYVNNQDFFNIKEVILNSGILKFLNITIDSNCWTNIYKTSLKSLIFRVCEYYDVHFKSTGEIGEIFKLSSSTIRRYLNIGRELNICSYSSNSRKNKLASTKKISKPVVQLTNEGEYVSKFISAREAGRLIFNNAEKGGAISACCRGDINSSRGFIWMYLSDYEKMIEEQDNKIS